MTTRNIITGHEAEMAAHQEVEDQWFAAVQTPEGATEKFAALLTCYQRNVNGWLSGDSFDASALGFDFPAPTAAEKVKYGADEINRMIASLTDLRDAMWGRKPKSL